MPASKTGTRILNALAFANVNSLEQLRAQLGEMARRAGHTLQVDPAVAPDSAEAGLQSRRAPDEDGDV